MNWIELKVNVDCPFCGEGNIESAEFDTYQGDDQGVNSGEYKSYCMECDKDFYFTARVNFEVESESTSLSKEKRNKKRKPPERDK